ncbi:asparaginase [Paenibacillus sp. 1P07SE]|uniref:asparaginase n=1 Tax=Paenibacillus sp. 1P07SE TaxID=3132209 RepID=UPI0039A65743
MQSGEYNRAVSLADVWRGEMIENVHVGHAAVTDAEGRLLAWAGDPGAAVYMRSTAKPVQALPALLHGTFEQLEWGDEELALMTASHRGEPAHIGVLERMLAASGVSESDLGLPETLPTEESARERLLLEGGRRRRIFHNCAGKHIGLLAVCRQQQWPMENYMSPGHPVQVEILNHVAELAGLEPSAVGRATDGCGFPVFALPLWRIALVYARLAAPPAGRITGPVHAALGRIASAMRAAPRLVEGAGRLATTLLDGGVIAKSGAQGIFGLALPALRIGVAVKIGDGSEAALPAVVASLLRSLAASPLAGHESLAIEGVCSTVLQEHPGTVLSDRGEPVGLIEPTIKLSFGERPRSRGRNTWLA